MSGPSFDPLPNVAALAMQDLVLTPLLKVYLYDAKFPPTFNVRFDNHLEPRKPDGYFHPSTHPLMTERQLFFYLTQPEKWVIPPFEFMGALSVTMGTATHDFIEMCMYDLGILSKPTGTCVCCGRPHGTKHGVQCREPGASDERLKSRGHMDGVLNIPGWGMGGFEFKTSNMMKLRNINDLDIEAFKAKWPEYYAQVQNYMLITGLRRFIVFFLGMGYPWTTKEFHIPFDPLYCMGLEAKYLRVLSFAERGMLPDPCCRPRSATARQCPARFHCDIGML